MGATVSPKEDVLSKEEEEKLLVPIPQINAAEAPVEELFLGKKDLTGSTPVGSSLPPPTGKALQAPVDNGGAVVLNWPEPELFSEKEPAKLAKISQKELVLNTEFTGKVMTDTKVSEKTEADKIWEEISQMPIFMFGLPNQKVKDYLFPVKVRPDAVVAKYTVSAIVAQLDPAINAIYDSFGNSVRNEKYEITEEDQYLIITRKSQPTKI